ncbi:MAG: response regulator [Acidimicrobiia bacterium]
MPENDRELVLVVDDEPMVREVVCTYLDREGYATVEATDGMQALELMRDKSPDLILLDVMLPKLDGYSVLSQLREHTDVPVIMLTARDAEVDRVLGLELGADDYVVKPFSPRELAARVRSVLRRTSRPAPDPVILEYGDLQIDGGARQVSLNGEGIDMPPMEFDLLFYLASDPRRVFSRSELLDEVWGSQPDWQDPSTVTVHVRRIRQKIEIDPDDPQRLLTVWGRGYRFEP